NVVMTSANCTLSGTTTVAASGGQAVFSNLVITAPMGATCNLTATAPIYGNTTSGPFMVFGNGTLNCEPTVPFMFNASVPGAVDVNHTGYAAGLRGIYNKDGSPCTPGGIGYTFTNDILDNNQVKLQWDTSTDPGAAFTYTVTWKPEYVNPATGMPSGTTKFAWFVNGVLTPQVIGRACIAQNPNGNPVTYLPAPYGNLNGAIDDTTMTIVVTPTAAIPTPPFAIIINHERMTVTGVAGNTWTVVRGVGTALASNPPDADGAFVMSTPLPLDAGGLQMQVCIAEEGFTIVPPGSNDCPTSTTPSPTVPVPVVPTACVLYSTTVYDIGDGLVG